MFNIKFFWILEMGRSHSVSGFGKLSDSLAQVGNAGQGG